MGTFFRFEKITASERATQFIGRFQTALALEPLLVLEKASRFADSCIRHGISTVVYSEAKFGRLHCEHGSTVFDRYLTIVERSGS